MASSVLGWRPSPGQAHKKYPVGLDFDQSGLCPSVHDAVIAPNRRLRSLDLAEKSRGNKLINWAGIRCSGVKLIFLERAGDFHAAEVLLKPMLLVMKCNMSGLKGFSWLFTSSLISRSRQGSEQRLFLSCVVCSLCNTHSVILLRYVALT